MVKLNPSESYEHLCNVRLTKEKYPIAWEHKVNELVNEFGMEREDAEKEVNRMEIELELYYEEGFGLFAVESDAVECNIDTYSPYSGEICENT